MNRAEERQAIEAEVNYYTDSVALLRARLYRRGVGSTTRLEYLQRRLDSARARLAAVPAEPPDRGGSH